jgi:hypothetical protein
MIHFFDKKPKTNKNVQLSFFVFLKELNDKLKIPENEIIS